MLEIKVSLFIAMWWKNREFVLAITIDYNSLLYCKSFLWIWLFIYDPLWGPNSGIENDK